MGKELAKISSIHLGMGGYQDAMFGVSIGFSGKGWGVADFRGTWGTDTKVTKNTKWTEAERSKHFADVMRDINKWIQQAKVQHLDQLKGIPVEVEFDDSRTLKSWRILEEVL